uniref:Pentatricopeptide repeat-containing protein n=1 Tax=Populus alba TaxID=43335 RepID=A0A4U5NBG6_POPAL|nr:hypothetical protein D5086_0000270190 [Populus alba]
MNGGIVRNRSQADKITDKRYVQKNGLSRRSDQAFLERGYGDDFEVERAAFKSFEQSNDVIGKTKVPMWKIEEKIQKIGNCPSQPPFISQIEKICKVANKPLVVTYTGLIQACLDSGNIQNGVYIFNQMRNFCPPNLVTCNIMLKARRSDYKFRVIPDIYTFNTMLDASIAENRWDDFEYVYQKMLHHGFHFNANRHLRMVAPWVPLQCKPSSSNGTGCF